MRSGMLFLLSLAIITVQAAPAPEPLKEDKTHVRVWNGFAQSVLALHSDMIKENAVRKEVSTGGYVQDPDFYIEESYYDKDSGKLVSRICWEKDNPDRLHTIEVNIFDNKDRLIRDYSAAYLPDYHNAPVQTLINLHHYNGGLHSFRQFDAGGDLIYEYCEGNFKGKPVQIRLFEDDLFSNDESSDRLMSSEVYKACFEGKSKRVGIYIQPQ